MKIVKLSASPLELINPQSLRYLSDKLADLVSKRLWLKVMIAMVLGIATGITMGPSVGLVPPSIAHVAGNWLALPGQLFLALVQMIVIPLIFASIIRGLAASENLEQLKKIGLRVFLFFIVTTAIATTIGIAIAMLIKPGLSISAELVKSTVSAVATAPASTTMTPPGIADLPRAFVTLLPQNPLSSMVESQMLQIVIFSMIIGVALISMSPKNSRPMLDLLGSLQEVCMTVVRWSMRLAPFAVFGLLAQLTMKVGLDALLGMAVYVATVLLGLLLMLLIYLIIVAAFIRMNPFKYLAAVREVMLLAFSTSSSAAVMPLSIKTAEENLGVRPSISQFVIPLGATINMNGTALYQGVATVFLAQAFGVQLDVMSMLLVVIIAVGASIGSPATPGVGIVILSMVLTTVGIPATGVALIIGVDRILDMSRTAINVSGDLIAAKVMDKWVGGSTSAEESLAQQEMLQRIREKSGEDVIIDVDDR
ncbi:MAG: dicarboxylate/amino acid:cation symporter [Gammaproteobacteria bacterium]|nr:dicarboxylate/amino acid:cation symporter [Gammaproteobacteria bacterium]